MANLYTDSSELPVSILGIGMYSRFLFFSFQVGFWCRGYWFDFLYLWPVNLSILLTDVGF